MCQKRYSGYFVHEDIIMSEVHTTSWNWGVLINDAKGNLIHLKIVCPRYFLFDTLFILLDNRTDVSSKSIFLKPHIGSIKIALNDTIKTDAKFVIHVYGLKTTYSTYDNVVCSGENHTKWSHLNDTIHVELTVIKECLIPLQEYPKVALPLIISQTPPSTYRLHVRQKFSSIATHQFTIFVQFKDQLRCFFSCNKTLNMSFPFDLPSCTDIQCKVISGMRETVLGGNYCVTTAISYSKTVSFKTFLTLNDNYRLFNRAMNFGSRKGLPGLKPIQYFYRNKSVEYFNEIIRQLNGEMRPYLKSNGGEQGSVLNSRLYGLFFSTFLHVETNKPNPTSFYGPIRIYVQATQMFNPNYNLYFGDFYCHYKRHHVTIVVTPKESPCNVFCQQYLMQLNIYNNPYLCLLPISDGSLVVFANMDITVEVFFTETVNILNVLKTNRGYIEKSETAGRGYALPTGIPKKATCAICNI